ncbi:uncharacterized protein LOC143244854 isoform X2 [Tachypleus tridentatus]|uniref:uncharacterized protein LOC143244854 isoform X2 n=1 Tax=Tachypleus tridentatus TaxID=6853 RepID=UPI003FD40C1E
MATMKRRYAVPPSILSEPSGRSRTVEDLHAWSIYRQNLNSDFTDSALGTSEKSQPPFGNFHLQESTIQKILSHPKYDPQEQQSDLGNTAFSYLRFGLPRVFPPSRVHYNGSSGYDSSDDVSPLTEHRRIRANMEFRNLVTKQSDFVAETSFARPDQHPKANSETDLLSHEIYNYKGCRNLKERVQHNSRDGCQRDPLPEVIDIQERREPSEFKAQHNFSFNSSESKAHRDIQKETSAVKNNNVPFMRPHLQVREMVYEIDDTSLIQSLCGNAKTKLKLLDNLSFEVHGGEILAILSTTALEGTTILDILADRNDKWRSCLLGDIIVNGLQMTPAKLKFCVAYVQQNFDFSPDLSVQQTLLFTSFLKKPDDPNRKRDLKGRINALLEDLGLGEIKHTQIRDITKSEKSRLNVACQLLLNTDIVLLDQPLKDMDIFDAFFLVEYLRQWAASGRIVIITIHPPTYEIFSMISRVDLATVDCLSPEAKMESIQRIQNLAEFYRHHQEALSDPGPVSTSPTNVAHSGFFIQVLALWIRVIIYMFPYNIGHFISDILFSSLMSILIGIIYWKVREGSEQEYVLDRIGVYYVIMGVALLPMMLKYIRDVSKDKAPVSHDVREGLYSYFAYIMSKLTYSMPSAVAVCLAYIIPVYSIAGFESDFRINMFGIYIGYMLLYLLAIRMLSLALGWLFSSHYLAAGGVGLILMLSTTTAGYTVHFTDLSAVFSWFQWVSPMRWTMEQVVILEFFGKNEGGEYETKYLCDRNPVIQQQNNLLVKAECGILNDAHALRLHDYHTTWPQYQPIIITLAFYIFWFLVSIFIHQQPNRSNKSSVS